MDPHLRSKEIERRHHFDDTRNSKVVKSDLRNNDKVVIHHLTRHIPILGMCFKIKAKGILYYAENEQEKKTGMVAVSERAWSHNLQRFVQEMFLRLQAELSCHSD